MDTKEESCINERKKEKLESFEQTSSSIARRSTSNNVQRDEEKEEREDIDYGSDDVILETDSDYISGGEGIDSGTDTDVTDVTDDTDDNDANDNVLDKVPKRVVIKRCCSVDNGHYIYASPESGTKFWFEIFGLCTPVLYVEVKGHRKAYSFFNDEPLPQELYEERTRNSLYDIQSKKAHDKMLREEVLRNGVLQLYNKKLSKDVKAKLAEMAFAYSRVNCGQDVEYKYVRCIKMRGDVQPFLGMHMIFTAHQQDDDSVGVLFSVHIETAFDPPEVRACQTRILFLKVNLVLRAL